MLFKYNSKSKYLALDISVNFRNLKMKSKTNKKKYDTILLK